MPIFFIFRPHSFSQEILVQSLLFMLQYSCEIVYQQSKFGHIFRQNIEKLRFPMPKPQQTAKEKERRCTFMELTTTQQQHQLLSQQ